MYFLDPTKETNLIEPDDVTQSDFDGEVLDHVLRYSQIARRLLDAVKTQSFLIEIQQDKKQSFGFVEDEKKNRLRFVVPKDGLDPALLLDSALSSFDSLFEVKHVQEQCKVFVLVSLVGLPAAQMFALESLFAVCANPYLNHPLCQLWRKMVSANLNAIITNSPHNQLANRKPDKNNYAFEMPEGLLETLQSIEQLKPVYMLGASKGGKGKARAK